MTTLDETWRKSTYSGTNGACVEVRKIDDVIEVRDSKIADSPILRFNQLEWDAFTSGMNSGEFNA